MVPPRVWWLAALVLAVATRALAVPCGGEGVVAIVADNASADAAVDLIVSGTRVASSGGCDAGGTGLATDYATTVHCSGSGVARCGHIRGLAPGLWVHRVAIQVAGSALQLQAQRGVVLAGPGVSNVVEWTAFGRTFVVTQATAADVVAQLDAARGYTATELHPALVRFSRATFPGAASPVAIPLQTSPSCSLVSCRGRETAYCFDGSRVTVDALDDDGLPGGVGLSVGTCNNSLMRLYGSDNTLRGLLLLGFTRNPPVTDPNDKAVDTIVVAGLASGGNRIEACTVVGPLLGDAVSVEGDASQPGAGTAPENLIVASEIRGAEDKGLKVDYGGVARVERSCLHDNTNGGIQATIGGTVTAIENVVQHNVGGGAEHGIIAGVPDAVHSQYHNGLATSGNVVRFNGARGVSVVNNASAALANDVIAENYRAGLRIETLVPGPVPEVGVRGALFAGNFAPGVCLNTGEACRADAECPLGMCGLGSGLVSGVGVQADQPSAGCLGCATPVVDLGTALDEGRNAFTKNANPSSGSGIDLRSTLVTVDPVPAAGNQWEHCGNATPCDVQQVATLDVAVGPGASPIDLGMPPGPRYGPAPVVAAISPPRPRAGEFVRVYAGDGGGTFNAIDGAAAYPPGLPADPCSPENPMVTARNAGDPAVGNRVMVTLGGVAYDAEVHQVTPAMLVFRMPVDCDAPGTLTVARGVAVSAPVALCDPSGCAGRPVGAACDDDDVCTIGESCQADGTCGGAMALDCAGQCLTGACDSQAGCVVRPASDACDDGDACTLDDHCSGTDATCEPGATAACVGACLTGACDAATGCIPRDVSAACSDGNACTTADHCDGVGDTCVGEPVACADDNPCTVDACDASIGCTHVAATDGTACPSSTPCLPVTCVGGTCQAGSPLACDDGHACTDDSCDAALGCVHTPVPGLAGISCHVTQLRTLLAAAAPQPHAFAMALDGSVACIERQVAKAAGAAAGTRGRTRHARRAARCAIRFVTRAGRGGRLSDAARVALVGEGGDTRTAVIGYFGL